MASESWRGACGKTENRDQQVSRSGGQDSRKDWERADDVDNWRVGNGTRGCDKSEDEDENAPHERDGPDTPSDESAAEAPERNISPDRHSTRPRSDRVEAGERGESLDRWEDESAPHERDGPDTPSDESAAEAQERNISPDRHSTQPRSETVEAGERAGSLDRYDNERRPQEPRDADAPYEDSDSGGDSESSDSDSDSDSDDGGDLELESLDRFCSSDSDDEDSVTSYSTREQSLGYLCLPPTVGTGGLARFQGFPYQFQDGKLKRFKKSDLVQYPRPTGEFRDSINLRQESARAIVTTSLPTPPSINVTTDSLVGTLKTLEYPAYLPRPRSSPRVIMRANTRRARLRAEAALAAANMDYPQPIAEMPRRLIPQARPLLSQMNAYERANPHLIPALRVMYNRNLRAVGSLNFGGASNQSSPLLSILRGVNNMTSQLQTPNLALAQLGTTLAAQSITAGAHNANLQLESPNPTVPQLSSVPPAQFNVAGGAPNQSPPRSPPPRGAHDENLQLESPNPTVPQPGSAPPIQLNVAGVSNQYQPAGSSSQAQENQQRAEIALDEMRRRTGNVGNLLQGRTNWQYRVSPNSCYMGQWDSSVRRALWDSGIVQCVEHYGIAG